MCKKFIYDEYTFISLFGKKTIDNFSYKALVHSIPVAMVTVLASAVANGLTAGIS